MKIALLGDIALFGRYSVEGNPLVDAYFADVAEHLRGFDVVAGNLETPFGAEIKAVGAKSAYIKANPANVALLKMLNVNLVNLANNHLFDYGVAGYRCTLQVLEANGIDWFGVEGRQVEFSSSGVAFHGYCSYNTNPLGVYRGRGPGVDVLNVPTLENRFRANRERGLLNILSIHSGDEHVHQPTLDDMRLARRLARIAPYVYHGHHPHVMQGVEEVDRSLIAYSLGNFCFDDVYTDKSPTPLVRQTRANRSGLIVELNVEEGLVRGHRLTTIYAGDDRMILDDAPARAAIDEYSKLLKLPDKEYLARRQASLAAFGSERRSMRDAQWYLKRLNLRTAEVVARGALNRRAYRRNVSEYLRDD